MAQIARGVVAVQKTIRHHAFYNGKLERIGCKKRAGEVRLDGLTYVSGSKQPFSFRRP
jgi:hypothetical protein